MASELDRPQFIIGSTRAERTREREEQHMLQARVIWERNLNAYSEDVREGARAAVVRGEPISYWSPVIDRLKRDNRLGEALELAWECMEVAEVTLYFPHGVAWGWARNVAVIARKMHRYDLEIEVIERFMALVAPDTNYPQLRDRLPAARKLLDKANGAAPK